MQNIFILKIFLSLVNSPNFPGSRNIDHTQEKDLRVKTSISDVFLPKHKQKNKRKLLEEKEINVYYLDCGNGNMS